MALIKDIGVKFEPCTVECMGRTIHGIKPTADRTFYHRTSIDNLKKIVEEGEIKPSKETKVVSLSSNPNHTFGGAVRIIIDKDDLDLEPVCYHELDEKEIYSAEREYRENINPNYTPNEFYSYCKTYPIIYAKECEFMSKEPIGVDKIKKIEYWLEDVTGSVSCENKYPPLLKYGGWYIPFEYVKKEIEETKKLAEKLGVPFEVKSCYKYMEVPCHEIGAETDSYSYVCAVELDDENLDRITNLDNPKAIRKYYMWSNLHDEFKEDEHKFGSEEAQKMWCRC